MSREVITLQLGSVANYVGAHYWNLEDEYMTRYSAEDSSLEIEPTCLFRAGQTLSGRPTYTPRLLALDLTGALGAMPDQGYTNKPPSLQAARTQLHNNWGGRVSLSAAQPIAPSSISQSLSSQFNDDEPELDHYDPFGGDPYRSGAASQPSQFAFENEQEVALVDTSVPSWSQLENRVRFWTDYLKVPLHSKSCVQVPRYHHNVHPFDDISIGEGLLSHNSDFSDEVFDRLRFFVEECDSMQGFQVVCDTHSGFGGMTQAMLQHVADEYTNRPVCVFGVSDIVEPRGQLANSSRAALDEYQHALTAYRRALLNRTLNATALSHELASLFVPLQLNRINTRQFPYLSVDSTQRYHSASLVAAALHSVSMSYRVDPLHTLSSASYGGDENAQRAGRFQSHSIPNLHFSQWISTIRPQMSMPIACLSMAFPLGFSQYQTPPPSSMPDQQPAQPGTQHLDDLFSIIPFFTGKSTKSGTYQSLSTAEYSVNLSSALVSTATEPNDLLGEWNTLRGAPLCSRASPFDQLNIDDEVAGLSYADHDERMQMHEYARVCALERAKRGRIAPIEMWTNYNNQSRSMASGSSYFEHGLAVPHPFPTLFRQFDIPDDQLLELPLAASVFTTFAYEQQLQQQQKQFMELVNDSSVSFMLLKDGNMSKDELLETNSTLQNMRDNYMRPRQNEDSGSDDE